jgi:hypothetical protein
VAAIENPLAITANPDFDTLSSLENMADLETSSHFASVSVGLPVLSRVW